MRYEITIHNSNSPDYFATPYHEVIGTATIVSKDRHLTYAILGTIFREWPSITDVIVTVISAGSYSTKLNVSIHSWSRELDGHRLPDLK